MIIYLNMGLFDEQAMIFCKIHLKKIMEIASHLHLLPLKVIRYLFINFTPTKSQI